MAASVLLFLITHANRLFSYIFRPMTSHHPPDKPRLHDIPVLLPKPDPGPPPTHSRRHRSSSVIPGPSKRKLRKNSLSRSSLPALPRNYSIYSPRNSSSRNSSPQNYSPDKSPRRPSKDVFKISLVTSHGIATERVPPGVPGDRAKTKTPKKRNSPRSKPLVCSSDSSIDLPRQTTRDRPRKGKVESRACGRSPGKSGNASRDKLGEKTEVEAKVKRLYPRPSLLRRSSKTSPKKYKEFGPSTHRNRERSSVHKPYKELYALLQSCKERAQNSNSLEVYTPLGWSASCPAGSSNDPQGSSVDPHAMEDDEEDDVDEVKEFKGPVLQCGASDGKAKSFSDVIKERHLEDMLSIGKTTSAHKLTSELGRRGYFDYNYSYNKFSRETFNNDNTKEGKKKGIENLYASLCKRIPGNIDRY